MISIFEMRDLLPAAKPKHVEVDAVSAPVTCSSRLRTDGRIRNADRYPGRRRKKAYSAGYRKMDAYSPQPVHGLAEAIGFEKNRVALVCLIGGLLGLATAYSLAVLDQPDCVSAEHRRAPAALLALVHHRDASS